MIKISENKNNEVEFDMGRAITEANRCLLCHDAPCSKGCPAGTDPAKFIRKLRMKNITGAIRTIKENNVLGGSCGLLCPVSNLCERECSATQIDRPIQIGKLQNFLIKHSYDIDFKPLSGADTKNGKVAIIGSGPAGLACGAELAKMGFEAEIFEKMPEAGGVLRYGVPRHRFSADLLEKEIEDVKNLGVKISCSTPIKGAREAEDLLNNGYKAVFISTGLWESVDLNESEKPEGVLSSIFFLKSLRENNDDILKYVKNKRVAVIGGGSVAIDCAESALLGGAEDVYIIYRRSFNEMPATDEEKISALKMGIHFLILTKPVDYISDDKNNLKGVELMRTRLGEADSSGRRAPVDETDCRWTMNIDTVIEAIGQKPEEKAAESYPSVKLDKKNLIIVDKETGETSVKGIFAGGDITRGPSIIVEAIKDGKKSAAAIGKYLREKL